MPRRIPQPKNVKAGVGQLPLEMESREKSIGMQCRGIFSSLYLRNNFTQSEAFPSEAEVRPIYEKFQTLWFTLNDAIYKRNEAFTREKFILPLFEALGWLHLPEEHMPKQHAGLRKRPDYSVFSDPKAYQRASEAVDTLALFRESVTVIEAKKAALGLDDAEQTGSQRLFPSQQVQEYLRRAADNAGNRFFNWAVLTNGREWRL